MGWWSSTKNEDDIIGDGPADIVSEMFQNINEKLGILPTIEEFFSIVLIVINKNLEQFLSNDHISKLTKITLEFASPEKQWVIHEASQPLADLLDEVTLCLESIVAEYEMDVERKPKVSEFLTTLEFVLAYNTSEYLSVPEESRLQQINF